MKVNKNHTLAEDLLILSLLTLSLLFMTTHTFANSVDPDQMADQDLHYFIQFVNLNENII